MFISFLFAIVWSSIIFWAKLLTSLFFAAGRAASEDSTSNMPALAAFCTNSCAAIAAREGVANNAVKAAATNNRFIMVLSYPIEMSLERRCGRAGRAQQLVAITHGFALRSGSGERKELSRLTVRQRSNRVDSRREIVWPDRRAAPRVLAGGRTAPPPAARAD